VPGVGAESRAVGAVRRARLYRAHEQAELSGARAEPKLTLFISSTFDLPISQPKMRGQFLVSACRFVRI
jgi:hypothetical protein